MALALRSIAATDVGRVRKNNEDSAYAGPHLLLLADGMGGAAAGEVASTAAVEVLRPLDKAYEAGTDLAGLLDKAVRAANLRLADLVRADSRRDGMGTTVTALLFDGERLALAHLGDSRAYRFRDGELTLISHDHTFVQSLVDEGRIGEDEAFGHPNRNLILRVLDGREGTAADTEMVDLRAGDRFLLCSDGIPDYVRDAEITRLLAADTIEAAALDLIEAALEADSPDNVTCIVTEVVDTEADVAPGTSDGSEPQLVGAAAELAPAIGDGDATTEIRRVSDTDNATTPANSATSTAAAAPAAAQATGDRSEPDTVTDTMPVTGPVSTEGPAPRPDDPDEQARYAPQAPRRGRWGRRLGIVVAVVVLIAAVGFGGYTWSQQQWYVGADGDSVAVFKGVNVSTPIVPVRHVQEPSDVLLRHLPQYLRDQVIHGMDVTDLANGRRVVASLQQTADMCVPPVSGAAGVPAASSANSSPPPSTQTSTQPSTQPRAPSSPTAGTDSGKQASGTLPTDPLATQCPGVVR